MLVTTSKHTTANNKWIHFLDPLTDYILFLCLEIIAYLSLQALECNIWRNCNPTLLCCHYGFEQKLMNQVFRKKKCRFRKNKIS